MSIEAAHSDSDEEFRRKIGVLKEMAATAISEDEARRVISKIAGVARRYRIQHGIGIPSTPAEQALALDKGYMMRPHVRLLSDKVASLVRDVERGRSRMLAVSMPPRAGKSTLASYYTPLWLLRRHPEWRIIMTSYDGGLTAGWARSIRRKVEADPMLGVALQPDGGAGARWATVEGGGMYATATNGAITGRGARVFIIDDPVKDFVDAHSLNRRNAVWNWWLSVAQTRLEPPYLVLVVMTRWHEDDFVGRLFSPDFEGSADDWDRVVLPAIAEQDDTLGREEGEPLLSPLVVENREQALLRWGSVRNSVGSYTFSAMYQQRPAPAKGAIFDASWWRFWSWDPEKATEDGRVVHLDPSSLVGARWVDSWDTSFKGTAHSDWVVGQRWVRQNANRYLIAQQRGRWSFTQTIDKMLVWSKTDDQIRSPGGHLVHERRIEGAANGPAIMDALHDRVSGLKSFNPRTSKEARARAVTPEIESGNVYLPHPSDPGNEWVTDLLSELRSFPHDTHDDQVDALTQALLVLRDAGRGQITVPGVRAGAVGPMRRDIAAAARSDLARRRTR